MAKDNKTYAFVKSPVIAAAIQGLYSFTNEPQAKKFLEQLKDHHIVSRSENPSDSEAMIWIRDYDVTPEQKGKGYKGNFGLFKVIKKDRSKFTIIVDKVDVDLKKHPVRQYEKKDHPNWGHAVLRGIKKKKLYDTIEGAQKELLFLQEDFPMVCIPAPNKLYAMIYEKVDGKSGVNKYVFAITNTTEGKFFIDFKLNTPKKQNPKQEAKKPVAPAAEVEKREAIGDFTSKVLIRRAAKKRPAPKKPISS